MIATALAAALSTIVRVPAGAATTYGVLNGPYGHADASGDYGASGFASQDHDFTAYVLNVGSSGGTPYASVNSGSGGNAVAIAAGTTFAIRNTLQNTGSVADTFTVSVPLNALPTGWTVALYTANTDGTINMTAPLSAAKPTPPVAANATVDYYAVYTASAAIAMNAYYPYNVTFRAASAGGGSHVTNDTQHVIFVNGFVQLTKSVAISPSQNGCGPQSFPNVPYPVCSGGKLTYTIAYKNLMPPSSGANNVSLSAVGFTLNEDGSGTGGWAQYTGGLQSSPVDVSGGTVRCPAGICANAGSFTDTIATLAPQRSGSVSFSVVVR